MRITQKTLFKIAGTASIRLWNSGTTLAATIVEKVGEPRVQFGIARTETGSLMLCDRMLGRPGSPLSNQLSASAASKFLGVHEDGLTHSILSEGIAFSMGILGDAHQAVLFAKANDL